MKSLIAQRIFASVFLVAILLSMYGFTQSPVAAAISEGKRIPVLAFGTDAADASKHTDTLMLAVLDPLMNHLQVLSIPRDTRVKIPGYRFRRINEVFGYHMRKTKDRQKSAKRVIEGVQILLSSTENEISIPYFFQADYSGFGRFVDLLGGVWVQIKTPMHYDDFAGNYHFHKDPGRYLLDGDEALKYVRFRGATGDRGRIYRQQAFLRNMAKRAAAPTNLLKFPQMVATVRGSFETNFDFWDFVYITDACRKLRSGKMMFYVLPGKPRGPYWKMNKRAGPALASAIVLGQGLPDEGLAPIVPHEELITIKVWNASEKRGLAREITRVLRGRGFDVVEWGNYAVIQAPTRVIDRTGQISKAHSVADVLGVETFHSEPKPKALADVEVILGTNYNGAGVLQ